MLIFIPQKIKVGYQNRKDTYSKKLAYVIYFDEKSVLRKQNSWEGWRDKKIDPDEFENIPTEGFVLNKKVGDYYYGHSWECRHAHVRIYDPRGFEFEISVENLLYILENTNSLKGKGLEGEFVYGWEGKDLILLPIDAPDYKEFKEYSDKRFTSISKEKIGAKDLVLGGTYLLKDNEEYIYIGRHNYYRYYGWKPESELEGKRHLFVRVIDSDNLNITPKSSIPGSVIECISNKCIDNYADILDQLEKDPQFCPIDSSKEINIEITLDEFIESINTNNSYWKRFYSSIYGVCELVKRENKTFDIDCGYQVRHSRYSNHLTLEEIYNVYKPYAKEVYLANGYKFKRMYK